MGGNKTVQCPGRLVKKGYQEEEVIEALTFSFAKVMATLARIVLA